MCATMNQDLRPSRCPIPACPSRATGKNQPPAGIVLHSLLRTATGPRRRYRCRNCRRTFTARTGTAYHRLRSSPAHFERVVHMSIEGTSKAAAARAGHVSPSTVARWTERASFHAQRVFDKLARDLVPEELQADEVRGYAGHKEHRQFVFAMLEVGARFWLSTEVGPRTLRNTRLLARDSRARCAFGQPRVLIVTDPFKYYGQEFKRAWGPTFVHVESGKIIRGGRVIRVHNKLVCGMTWQLEAARERCTVSRKLNTAFIERLNLFIRRSLAAMQRKTNSAARTRGKLREAMDLLRCYYNFVRPHSSLKYGGICRTPGEIAGLVTRRLSWRDVFTAFGPRARVPWIKDEVVRRKWREGWACVPSNT
jgi:transposase-like protein